jgi:endo-beta-N-acetylglucosaminidase D
MKQKLLALSLSALAIGSVSAQSLKTGYVDWPSSQTLPTYVTNFKNGNLNLEDENFFISRVAPKVRFTNTATQVNQSLTDSNSKRLCLWLPVTTSYEGAFNLNALPNSVFDSEVFSVWSYVDVYGDWTSPHGWVPGNFADVAHKNGVAVSGVASIPNASVSGTAWGTALTNQVALSSDDLGKFLWYHGVDGLGYNSEFSGFSSSNMQKLTQQHEDIISYLTAKGNPIPENIWYDGTNVNGSISFDSGLNANNYPMLASADGSKRRASLFTNYNWTNLLSGIQSYATSKGANPLYVYAGMNMQGGEPKSGESYPTLQNYNISMGYWGAHQYNMFWLNRTAKGSSPLTTQATYIYDTERFFSNAAQNPAVSFSVYTQRNHYPTTKFFGVSKFKRAESTLCWDLSTEPFITYFNMGNGQFFNWMGDRVSSNSWYNIGIQDYMPTWRYWWTPTLMASSVASTGVGMTATPIWTDAYFGGSCLQIKGTASEAYLQLFKTQFKLQRADVITVKYKLVSGSVDKVSLVATVEGAETSPVRESNFTIIDSNTEVDEQDWQTATFELTGLTASQLSKNPLALIALHFTGAKDVEIRLGEVSIVRPDVTSATPAAPKLKSAKVLGNHYKGVDGKVIFEMESSKTDGPVYNLDVKTSMFKLYAREEGGDAKFIGATTSWAGLLYNCPFDANSTKKVQFGVSAVSLDMKSESDIVWSDLMDKGEYTINDSFSLDKSVIKPNEEFTIGYDDPKHAASTWALYDKDGKKVYSTTGTSFTTSLSTIGGYNLVVDEGTANELTYGYYVQISGESIGALPEIYTLAIDGDKVTSESDDVEMKIVDTTGKTKPVTVSYTGRSADGTSSRGINFNQKFIGCKIADLGLQDKQSFSVSFWVKYTNFNGGTWALLDITNRGGSWPVSNWGWCWIRGNSDGSLAGNSYTFRGYASDGTSPGELKYTFANSKFNLDAWTHVVMTFEYNPSNTGLFRSMLYLNGIRQESTWLRGDGGSGTGTTETYAAKNYALQSTDWLSTGGIPYTGTAVDGIIDDFQIWSKAMDQDDVNTSFAGLDPNNLPADVLCYWDFESDADASDYGFASTGSKPGVKLYNFECVGSEDAKEGQGTQTPGEAEVNAGSPFVSGTGYKVVTTPSWSARKLEVTNAQGTGEAGSANVAFKAAGDYTLTLTVSNSYGEATAEYPVFKVSGSESGVNDVLADGDYTAYTDADAIFVQVEQDGQYVLTVYDMQGRVVTARAATLEAGQLMQVKANNGSYVVKVRKDGKELRAIKILKK